MPSAEYTQPGKTYCYNVGMDNPQLPADPLEILARQILADQAAALPLLDGVVILLPNIEIAPRLRRLLLEGAARLGHAALLGPHITTLSIWLQDMPLPQKRLANQQRTLLLVESLREHSGLFGHANLWALADSLLQLFDELTLNKVGLPDSLEDFTTRLGIAYGTGKHSPAALGREASIVHTLWFAWQQQLAARGRLDTATACLLQLSARREQLPQRLYLAGLQAENRAEEDWLESLPAERVWHLPVQTHEDAKSEYAHWLVQALYPQPLPLAHRARQLAEQIPHSPAQGRLTVHFANSAELEARAVELQVRRHLLEGRREIAVITENRKLARRVRALLERAGVGVQDAAGWPLSTTRAAAVLERWLQCVEEDFPYQALLDFLKSTVPEDREERMHHLHVVHHLEQGIIRQGNIERGLRQYQQQLRERRNLLPTRMKPSFEAISAMLDWLEEAATPLLLLKGSAQTPERLLSALQQSLQRLGLHEQFSTDAAGRQLLHELETLANAAQGETIRLAWSEFRTWLGHSLEQQNFHPPRDGSRVQLMGLEQSLLGRYDALIIGGAEQEYLPGAPPATPFFNEAVRQQLGLPGQARQRERRLQQFHALLLSAPRITLTLRRQQDGEEILPSPWVAALLASHRLAWPDDLADPVLAAWSLDPASEVFRCDSRELPRIPGRAQPVLPAACLPDSLSASGYQQLINCPYQFFAARGLGLSAPDEIREAMAKVDYGERVHLCLQAFHKDIQGLPGPFAHVLTVDKRPRAIALLEEISRTVFADDIARSLLHTSWLQRWQQLIPAYVDWEISRQDEGWRNHDNEAGKKKADWWPGRQLRGTIDRIDTRKGKAGLIDYKTGKPASHEEVMSGEAVQLPFYALLADAEVEQLEYLYLDDSKQQASSIAILQGEELDSITRANAERLQSLFAEMENGAGLPAWGDAKTCSYCEFSGVCRRHVREEHST